MSWLNEELSPFGPAAAPGARPAVPWEDPGLPRLASFYRTLGQVLRRPGKFFTGAAGREWAEPLAFGLIAATLGLLAMAYWHLILAVAGQGPAPAAAPGRGAAMALMVATPALALTHLAWGSLCLWAGVALTGVKTPFAPVWRIFCYAQASMAAALLPVLGGPVSGVWMLFLTFRGVQRALGVGAGRALTALAAALLVQLLVLVVLLGSLMGLFGLVWFSLFLG